MSSTENKPDDENKEVIPDFDYLAEELSFGDIGSLLLDDLAERARRTADAIADPSPSERNRRILFPGTFRQAGAETPWHPSKNAAVTTFVAFG